MEIEEGREEQNRIRQTATQTDRQMADRESTSCAVGDFFFFLSYFLWQLCFQLWADCDSPSAHLCPEPVKRHFAKIKQSNTTPLQLQLTNPPQLMVPQLMVPQLMVPQLMVPSPRLGSPFTGVLCAVAKLFSVSAMQRSLGGGGGAHAPCVRS